MNAAESSSSLLFDPTWGVKRWKYQNRTYQTRGHQQRLEWQILTRRVNGIHWHRDHCASWTLVGDRPCVLWWSVAPCNAVASKSQPACVREDERTAIGCSVRQTICLRQAPETDSAMRLKVQTGTHKLCESQLKEFNILSLHFSTIHDSRTRKQSVQLFSVYCLDNSLDWHFWYGCSHVQNFNQYFICASPVVILLCCDN